MRSIKIINGVYGYRPADSKFIEPKHAGDPPFEVEDTQAEHLVAIKVAVYADPESVVKEVATGTEDDGKKTPGVNMVSTENGSQGKETPPETPKYNIDMKAAELREILESCQLPFKVGMSKADMVAALDAYFEDEVEDEDAPPALGAEDPIV